MRAIAIVQQQLEHALPNVHAARIRAVFAAAQTVLKSGKLALTSLGRAIADRTTPKHGIKRIDRLLGNRKLHVEHTLFYEAIARSLVLPHSRPTILVDWTSVTPKLWALVAAVPFEGRAVTVYAEVHPTSRYLKPRVHRQFLQNLSRVLPVCRPIVVTDAGFRSPWMHRVTQLGWDYVGRVRHAAVRLRGSKVWAGLPILWSKTRRTANDFGDAELGRQIRYPSRLVGLRGRGAIVGRPRRRDCKSSRQRRTAREPWILATSLSEPPAQIAAIYRLRMQIEETFRDTKSTRFGLSLAHVRTRSEHRAKVLLLLAALAHLFAIRIGDPAEILRLHLRYQANTVTRKRVLSLALLGRLVATSLPDENLTALLKATTWSFMSRAQLLHA